MRPDIRRRIESGCPAMHQYDGRMLGRVRSRNPQFACNRALDGSGLSEQELLARRIARRDHGDFDGPRQ